MECDSHLSVSVSLMFIVICTRESLYHPWPSSVEGSGNSQGLKPTRPGTLHPGHPTFCSGQAEATAAIWVDGRAALL